MSFITESVSRKNVELNSQISVCVANDGHEIWTFVRSLLEDCGYGVTVVTEGRKGLQLVAEARPDLVIVGEDLADISGLDWIIKVHQQDPTIRLSFVADYWRDAEFYQRLKKDFSVSLVVHRPFKPSLFTLQIESLFGRAESWDSHHLVEQEDFVRHEAMKHRYAKMLPLRVQQLNDAVYTARNNSHSQRAIDDAMRLAHNMKGSARSCGFRQIGESAEQIERSLANILNGVDTYFSWSTIEKFLQLIQEQVSSANSKYSKEQAFTEQLPSIEEANHSNVLVISSKLVVESLEKNLKLLHAESFEKALHIAQKKPIDGALIDMSLHPRQSVLNFADTIRELEGNQNLPLGFISSGFAQDDQVEATRAGGSIFLEREADTRTINRAAEYLSSIRQGGRPRILLIDDDSDFCQIISATLGLNGMMVRTLNEPHKLIAVLQEYSPELILLDVNMPIINGFDVCRQLRSMTRWQDTPVIVLTAHTGPAARINAFEAGADDYLPKPIIETELLSRIRFRLERARLLKERADKDLLTGLFSRRAFTDQVSALIAESTRHNFNFCIGFIDVDHFKMVNDVHGHLAGDEVLKQLGNLLSRRFRVEDLRARWGGEEFALAFPHATSCVMRASLSRVLEEFRGITFEGEQCQPFRVTFSAGMATFPGEGTNLKDLLGRADQRLYTAKTQGRNTIVVND